MNSHSNSSQNEDFNNYSFYKDRNGLRFFIETDISGSDLGRTVANIKAELVKCGYPTNSKVFRSSKPNVNVSQRDNNIFIYIDKSDANFEKTLRKITELNPEKTIEVRETIESYDEKIARTNLQQKLKLYRELSQSVSVFTGKKKLQQPEVSAIPSLQELLTSDGVPVDNKEVEELASQLMLDCSSVQDGEFLFPSDTLLQPCTDELSPELKRRRLDEPVTTSGSSHHLQYFLQLPAAPINPQSDASTQPLPSTTDSFVADKAIEDILKFNVTFFNQQSVAPSEQEQSEKETDLKRKRNPNP